MRLGAPTVVPVKVEGAKVPTVQVGEPVGKGVGEPVGKGVVTAAFPLLETAAFPLLETPAIAAISPGLMFSMNDISMDSIIEKEAPSTRMWLLRSAAAVAAVRKRNASLGTRIFIFDVG